MANTRFKTHHGLNATANSYIDGKLEVTGDLVVTGNVSVSGSSSGDFRPDADQRNLGNTSLRWNLLGFAANLASTLTANGATSLSNTLTVTGAATFQNTLTLTGWVNTAANLVVGGSANVTGQLNVAGNSAVVGTTLGTGNVSFTGGLLTVNTNGGSAANTLTVGAANVSVDSGVLFVDAINNRVGINNTAPGVALRVTGAVDVSAGANVGGTFGVAGIATLAANAILGGTLQTIAGNSNFDSGVLFVDSVNNRVGINNTAPTVALEISGSANATTFLSDAITVSSNGFLANSSALLLGNSSVNVQVNTSSVNAVTHLSGAINTTSNGFLANSSSIAVGNASVNVVITPAGITSAGSTGVNPYANGIGATLGTSTQRWVITANSVAANSITVSGVTSSGNTTITGWANVSTSVNSATLSVGTSFIANTEGAFHTGIVNAASHTTSGITANTLGVYPISNTVGTALGSSTHRWILTANSGDFSSGISVGTINTTSNGITANTTLIAFGNATINVVVNTSSVNVATYLSGAITVSSNGFLANSSTLLLGNSSVSVAVNTSSVNVATHLSGAITASSNGFLANSSSLRLGNTSVDMQINTSSITIRSGTQNTVLGAGELTLRDTSPMISLNDTNLVVDPAYGNTVDIFYDSTYLTFRTNPNGVSNNRVLFGLDDQYYQFGSNSTHSVSIEGNYGRITTRGQEPGVEGGIAPYSNTSGTFLGNTVSRWYLFANTGNFSNNIVLGTRLSANGSNGASGEVLLSGGASGNAYWGSASVFNTDLTINQSSPAITFNDTDNTSITANSMYIQFNAGSFTLVQMDDGDGSTNTRFTFAMTTGNLTIDGELSATSDERKKSNIVTVDSALSKVDSMRGVYFNRNDGDGRHVGVIAQEIQKVLPEVVSEDADGYLSVSYGNIVGVLIEAIKELKQEIEELKNGNKS